MVGLFVARFNATANGCTSRFGATWWRDSYQLQARATATNMGSEWSPATYYCRSCYTRSWPRNGLRVTGRVDLDHVAAGSSTTTADQTHSQVNLGSRANPATGSTNRRPRP